MAKWRPALIVLLLMLIIAVGPLAAGIPAHSQLNLELYYTPTNIYNMISGQILDNEIRAGSYIGNGKVVVAGTGFLSVIDVNNKRTIWTESIVGEATSIGVDSSNPLWIAVGTDQGEITAFKQGDVRERIDYYTAKQEMVRQTYVVKSGSEYRIIATVGDDPRQSYVYVYEPGLPYWSEIGPIIGDEPKSDLSGVSVAWVAPAKIYQSRTTYYYDAEKVLLNLVSAAIFAGSLKADIYYNNTDTLLIEPALPGTQDLDGLIEVRNLTYYLLYRDAIVLQGVVTGDQETLGNTLFIRNLYPTIDYTLVVIYEVKLIDNTSNVVVDSTCYYNTIPVTVEQGATTDLGNVILNPGGRTKLDCINRLGINLNNLININIMMNINTLYAPETLGDKGTYQLKIMPTPRIEQFVIDEPIFDFIKPYVKPSGMPADAEFIFAVGSSDSIRVYIYLLDEKLNPINYLGSGSYVEEVYLKETVSKITISPDGNRIYIGTNDGRLVMLEWSQNEKRYIAKNSIKVSYDDDPITSIHEVAQDYIVVGTSAGFIQLVKISEWYPLWRGGLDYVSLNANTTEFEVFYADAKSIYGVGTDKLVIFNHGLNEYQPVVLNLSVVLKNIYGETTGYTGDATIYAISDTGEIVLKTKISEGIGIVYLPIKPIDLYIELKDIGVIRINDVLSKFPQEFIQLDITLRQIRVQVFTPEGIGDPARDPGYMLVSGPKAGAEVVLTSQETNFGQYTVISTSISNTTDIEGIVNLIVFDGVIYDGIVIKEEYFDSTFTVNQYEPVNISVELHPKLYRVDISLVDADAASNNVIYRINGTMEITNIVTQRSVTVPVSDITTYYLPKGKYEVKAYARHYMEGSAVIEVPGQRLTSIMLDPEKYIISVIPIGTDSNLNIDNLVLENATIYIRLIEPYNGDIITVNTGDFVDIRYGKYEIQVRDWVAEYSVIVTANSNGVITVKGPLNVAEVQLNIIDSEAGVIKLDNINLYMTYIYNEYIVTKVIRGIDGGDKIAIPYGLYNITIERMGYYETQISVNVSEKTFILSASLDPYILRISVNVLFNDVRTGIASGGVPTPSLKLELIDPAVNTTYILYGNENGEVVGYVREGIYKIVVESPYTITKTQTLEVTRDNTGAYIVQVVPRYSMLNITVVDSEIPVILQGAEITIVRLGPGEQRSISITSITGKERVLLPVGEYVVIATITSRYEPAQQNIMLMDDSSITIRITPIKLTVEASAIAEDAYIIYNGIRYPLPLGIVGNATIRLVPSDPLLVSLGVEPIEVVTPPNGTILIDGIRAGTYMVVATRDGYTSRPVITPILVGTRSIQVPVKPIQWEWQFYIKDKELIDEFSDIDEATIRINEYNNVPAGIEIGYRSGDIILMPTGVYNISATKKGYQGIPINVKIDDTGNSTLYMIAYRARLTLNLESNVAGEVNPVQFGTISAVAIDVPLKDPVMRFNVSNSMAIIEVRPGTYELTYYIDDDIQVSWNLGVYNITQNYTDSVAINVDVNPVRILINDAEYNITIPDAVVTIRYIGPFGEREEFIDNYRVGIRDTVLLPPGYIDIVVDSENYVTKTERIAVGGVDEVVVYLNPIKIPIIITFVNPDGTEINEVMNVVMKHRDVPLELVGVMQDSAVYFNEVRLGSYTLRVIPQANSIYNVTEAEITVTLDGVEPQGIVVNYKLFNVTILMIDTELNNPISVPYRITIDRKGEASQMLGFPMEQQILGTANLSLPPGEYTITITPVELDVYTPPPQVAFKVPNLLTIKIDMQPKRYPVSILVLDDRGKPLDGALVSIQTDDGKTVAAGYTDNTGKYNIQLRFGIYTISVERVGYLDERTVMQVPLETAKTITMEPELVTKIRRMAPLIIGVTGLVILVTTLYVMRERLTRRILEEEEYF